MNGKYEKGFNFCKTNEKPYDPVVVAAILLMRGELGSRVRISSDGFGYKNRIYFEIGQGFKLLCEFLRDNRNFNYEPDSIKELLRTVIGWFCDDATKAALVYDCALEEMKTVDKDTVLV